jgi:spore coat polysaccharide biosynthesis predicted glycosyltransferase SpsG
MGHMMRCLSFAESLPVSVMPILVIRDSTDGAKVTEPLIAKGWTIHPLPADVDDRTDAIETARLAQEIGARLLVTDLCHREILKDPMRLVRYHRELRAYGAPFVLSIEDSRMTRFTSNVAVIWNSSNERELTGAALDDCRVLVGLRYFICNPKIAAAGRSKHAIREEASRVLVSIGGSDPKDITAKVARALTTLPDSTVEVKIVLGTAATTELLRKVEEVCDPASGLTLLKFTDSMATLLQWADIAIIGEGLIKYEAAITGTPSLMISQFDHDSQPIREFLRLGCARYLGSGDKLREADIADAMTELLADSVGRAALSHAGKTALDGRGMERIFNEVLKNVLA